MEFLRFSDETGELHQPYRDALVAATEAVGGEVVWRGSLDYYGLGEAEPTIDELVVTRYPSPLAYLRALRDVNVRSASASRAEGLEIHWIYTLDERAPSF